MRIDPTKARKEPTYQVILYIVKLSPCYNTFVITTDVPKIYMQQFWLIVSKVKDSSLYPFQLDNKKFKIGIELFCEILIICPRVPNKKFVAPQPYDAIVTFIKSLGYKDVMVNNDIKNSKAYQTHLSISTGVVIPKKTSKGIKTPATPKKNVTEKPTSDKSNDEEEGSLTRRRPAGVIIKDTPKVSTKKTLDQSKSLKTLTSDQRLKKILSTGDERTESESVVAKTKKPNEETSDDDEMHLDKRVYTDEEIHDDEDVHDEDEKHVDADKEMHDAKNIDNVKDDQEVVETEKGVSKNTEEKKGKDDQAGSLAFVTQKVKSKVPQSSSNLPPLSNYGNQFLNFSSNTSLVGTVKESIKAEFKSLLNIQIQQEIPYVLSAPLLDVLVLVIPLQTTPTPPI
nr:hypothetical protein [Tanacetum cinerariifolium]